MSQPTPENEDTLAAAFSINPAVLSDLLSRVTKNVPRPSNTKNHALYIAVIGEESSDLAREQRIADETGDGRVVVGMAGTGRNHVFDEAPCISVEKEGELVCKHADQLKNWADGCTLEAKIEVYEDGTHRHFKLYNGTGPDADFNSMDFNMSYQPGRPAQDFPQKQNRFETPVQNFTDDEVAIMLSRGESVAPSSSSEARTGDLVFRDGEAQFATVEAHMHHTICSSQRVDTDLPVPDFEWEVTPDQLSVLSDVLSRDSARGRHDQNPGGADALQLAFEVEAADDHTILEHRQLHISREEDPVKDWTPEPKSETWAPRRKDREFFGMESCKLFAEPVRSGLESALQRIWAVHPAEEPTIRPDTDNNGHGELILEAGDLSDPDVSSVDARIGDSEIEKYFLNEGMWEMTQDLASDSRMLGIYSHPSDRGELSNGFMICPESDEDVPSSYAYITWTP